MVRVNVVDDVGVITSNIAVSGNEYAYWEKIEVKNINTSLSTAFILNGIQEIFFSLQFYQSHYCIAQLYKGSM